MTTTTTTADLNVPEVVPAVLTKALYIHDIGMHTKTFLQRQPTGFALKVVTFGII
jgi:hypothetical protein